MMENELKEYLYKLGASLVGYADLKDIDFLHKHMKYGVAIAVKLTPDIVEGIKDGPTEEYFNEYDRINKLLDDIVIACVKFIESQGYKAIGQTSTYVTSDDNLSTSLPHKTVATRAGLGWIGKNALLVTPEYGSAIRLSSIITEMPLIVDSSINESKCGKCINCVTACPASAIKGELWNVNTTRDQLIEPFKCRRMARELLKQKIGIEMSLCGKCIEVCPFTKGYTLREEKVKKNMNTLKEERYMIINTLYVSDLDGTLLNTNTEISEKSKEIINALVKRGVKFTYATARSFTSASKILQGLQLSIPVITYNGAFFIEPADGKVIYSTSFSNEQIKYISTVFIENKIYPLVYSLLEDEEHVSWIQGKENAGVLNYLKSRVGDKRLRGVENEEALYLGSIFYFTAIGEKDKLELLKEYFQDKSQFICTLQRELYGNGEYWLEIMPKDATKAMGIKRLKEIIDCDKVICFGDAINDISMFEIADESYAVRDANLQLKKISTGVIGSNNEDGVALWLLEHTR
jgi:Cof subfamily protein (haloacid dehalogenase superfamily)